MSTEMFVQKNELLVQETGLSVLQRASGEGLIELCGALAVEFAGPIDDEVFDVRYPDFRQDNRRAALFLLGSKDVSKVPHLGLLPTLGAQETVHESLERVEILGDVMIETADVYTRRSGESYIELYPDEDSDSILRKSETNIRESLRTHAENLGIATSPHRYRVPKAITVAWLHHSCDPSLSQEALSLVRDHLPLETFLTPPIVLPKLEKD